MVGPLKSYCEYGVKFDIEHVISCKKGGFTSLWHNH